MVGSTDTDKNGAIPRRLRLSIGRGLGSRRHAIMSDLLIGPARRLSRSLSFRQKFLLVFLISVVPGLFLLG